MSGGGKQTTTTTNELKLPEWINQGGQQVWTEARAAAAANPIQAYGGPMAAGSNANLDAASDAARANVGTGTADLDRARQLTDMAATGTTGRVTQQDWNGDQASRYMNPYQDRVQQRTMDMMMRQNAQELDGLGDAASTQRAYGGSRHAVLEAETRGAQNRNMLDYLAQSNERGYNDAYSKFAGDRSARQGADATNAGLDAQDLARRQSAGGQFAGIGQTSQGMANSDVDMLLRSGLIDQETAQRMIDGDYSEFLRMQDAPMMRYMQLMGMLSGAPSDRSETSTSTSRSGGSMLSTLLGVGSLAASVFSDERLKENIKPVGKLDDGLTVYKYNYKTGGPTVLGVMAQEVEKKNKAALGPEVDGFKTVNYDMVGA